MTDMMQALKKAVSADALRSRFIAVKSDGEVLVHIPSTSGSYATLCAVSTDDAEESGREVPLPKRPKIDCKHCAEIIRVAKTYRLTDLKD